MKYQKKSAAALTLPLAVGTIFVANSCKEAEAPSKTALLQGDWEWVEIAGYDIQEDTYRVLWKFQGSGSFQYCIEDDITPSYNECYNGNWSWQNAETTLSIGLGTDNLVLDNVQITTTTLTADYDYNQTAIPVKFIKVN